MEHDPQPTPLTPQYRWSTLHVASSRTLLQETLFGILRQTVTTVHYLHKANEYTYVIWPCCMYGKLTGRIYNVDPCRVRWAGCDSVVGGGVRRHLDNTCEGLQSFKNIIEQCWHSHTSSAAATEYGSQETTSVVSTICNESGRNVDSSMALS